MKKEPPAPKGEEEKKEPRLLKGIAVKLKNK